MALLTRKRATRFDEAQLLPRASPAPGLPEALLRAESTPWSEADEPRERLLSALGFYAEHEILLREQVVAAPRWSVDLPATRRLLLHGPRGRVSLKAGTGEDTDVAVQDLLDANTVLARFCRLHQSWQGRARHTWSDWEQALAWTLEDADPHGALFDLPGAWRDLAHEDLPLFGWTLDLVHGARPNPYGVAVGRVTHANATAARTVPLADLPRCFRRGQTAEERLRSRPIRIPGTFEQGHVEEVDVADRRIVVRRVDRLKQGDDRRIELDLDVIATLNPDLAPLLAALRVHELVELQRRLEAHAAAGGVWVGEPDLRTRVGRPHLPLTGWHLAKDAFSGLERGEVRLTHPLADHPLAVSARAAWRMMRELVDPRERLLSDPVSDGQGGLAFLREVLPEGCGLSRHAGDARSWPIGHAAFVRANPELVDALLGLHPDLLAWSEDPDLPSALLARQALQPPSHALDAWLTLLEAPVPIVADPLARSLAAELLERSDIDVERRFIDRQGQARLWVAVTPAGRFRFQLDAVTRFRALPGPVSAAQILYRDGATDPDYLDLTPAQLVFAHPPLARQVVDWQRRSGLLGPDGQPVPTAERLGVLVRRASLTLEDAHLRTRQHLRISRELKEDPRRGRTLETHLARVEANLGDLKNGRTLRAWIDADQPARVGMAVATGGAGGGGNRALDDRVRVTDGVVTRFLGRFRLVLVGGGDSLYEVPAGPLITRLLDDMEGRIAVALRDAVDLDEAMVRTRDAILQSGTTPRTAPYCSLVVAFTHLDTGRTGILWSGNAAAWCFQRRRGSLRRLSWDHTAEGIVGLGIAVGLRPADAVSMLLQLNLRKTQRRDIEALSDEQLLAAAERYVQPGRRRALRAAMGGARPALIEEHDRLLTLLRTWRDAYDRVLDLSPVEQGQAMLFARWIRVRPDDRLIFATDGFTSLLERHSLLVQRALNRPDPQRTAEWLAELTSTDPDSDDLAMVVIDPPPDRPFIPSHTRRRDVVFHRTTDQALLLEGGVVPALLGSSLPSLRVLPRMLAPFDAEVDELLRTRRMPPPERDPAAFVEAVARWALARESERPVNRRPGETLRELHEVLDEADDDPADETLLTLYVLRRRGVHVRYTTGVRLVNKGPRPQMTEACWLIVTLNRVRYILDMGLGPRPGLRPVTGSTGGSRSTGLLAGIGGGNDRTEYVAHAWTLVEVPVDSGPSDDDPWLRLTAVHSATPKVPPSQAAPPASPPRAAPAGPSPSAPTPGAAPAPTVPVTPPPPAEVEVDDGWLNLD